MRYTFLFIILFSCKNEHNKNIDQLASSNLAQAIENTKAIDTLITETQKAQDKFYFILGQRQKRDSFMFKKYEFEVLYYQTEKDSYRVKANRMIDSVIKYDRVLDSIRKTFN